jgi:chromosome segregation ATPase
MDDEAKPYLLTEASRLTGLSVDALRKRIERKKLHGSRSNEDGQWRVWLTSKDVETAKSGQTADKSGQDADGPLDESRTIKALEGEVVTLREGLARERERADRVEAELSAERARAGQAEREREEARVKAATAEGEVKGVREALDQARQELADARRPFWRRWIG